MDFVALNGRVLIPTHIWKAIYDPVRGTAAAYFVPNAVEPCWQALSMDELREKVSVDVFPGFAGGKLDLPEPGAESGDGCPNPEVAR